MHPTESGYAGLLYGGVHWNPPPAPKPAPLAPAATGLAQRLAYRFPSADVLRYDVEFSWQVDGLGLHEFLEGDARVALQGTRADDGYVIRCTTERVSEPRASAKAPPFSRRTRAQIVLGLDGSLRGMKWNGMVVPFRAPFWLTFPAQDGAMSDAWTRDVELGLPLLEKLCCPVEFNVDARGLGDTLIVGLAGGRSDAESSVRVQGEVTFSRSRGCALETRIMVAMKGRTDVLTHVKTRLVEPAEAPVEEQEAFLFVPRPLVKKC